MKSQLLVPLLSAILVSIAAVANAQPNECSVTAPLPVVVQSKYNYNELEELPRGMVAGRVIGSSARCKVLPVAELTRAPPWSRST